MDFGITPQQLVDIVTLWRRCGRQIADTDCGVGDLPVSGSAALASLNACLGATRDATTARSQQLDALADALATFGALTVEADASAAAALAAKRQS